jgi:hypothetical protein
MVIISNLIQVQKPGGQVHANPPGRDVHFEAYRRDEGDEDLAAVPVDDEEVSLPHGEKPPDGPDPGPVLGDDLAPDDLEIVKAPLAGRGERFLGGVEVATGQCVGGGQGIDAPELQNGGVAVERQGFDPERLLPPPPVSVNGRKKKGPGPRPDTASA